MRRVPLSLSPLPLAGEGREGARSPIGVPPRLLPQRANATAQLQIRTSWDLVGRSDPKASNNRVRKTVRSFSGRYPLLPVPVQRGLSRRPVVMPAGRSFPKPPGCGVYRSARGHRTRSAFGSTLGRRRPSLSEIRYLVIYLGTFVNKLETRLTVWEDPKNKQQSSLDSSDAADAGRWRLID